ncbi:MAG: hypothetical protein EBX80_03665, partial [Acidimicrobiia bacterium]|nr:hypothetical protein [Acidimicrobiia bacterium]
MAGLNPDNIRLDQTAPSEGLDDEPVQVVVDEGVSDTDTPEMDDAGNILRINHPDGSVTVSIDGNPLERAGKASAGWFDNLVDEIDGMELSRISEELLRGIRDDLEQVLSCFPALKNLMGRTSGFLSGGEMQMLLVGRALMARPRIML